MIDLRIDVGGRTSVVRLAGPTAVLGTGPEATVVRGDAGWRDREAVLVATGDALLVVAADGSGERRIRAGESIEVGGARVTLVAIEGAPTAPVASAWVPQIEDAPRAPVPAPPAPRAGPEAGSALPRTSDSPGVETRARKVAFEGELVAAMRKAPWLAVSVAVHAVLFAVLLIFGPTTLSGSREAPTSIVVAAAHEPDALTHDEDAVEADTPPLEPKEVEVEEEEPLETRPPLRASRAELEVPPELEPPPPAVSWIGPSFGPLPSRVKKPSAKPAATTVSFDDASNDDPDQGLDMTRRAAAKTRSALGRGHPLGRTIARLRRDDLLVVRGTFDHMEVVLDELGLPYTLASPQDVADDDLRTRRLVFWNCMDPETALPPRERPAIIAHLREFVARGGYLFTTDWGISNVLMLAFPGTLVTSGSPRSLPEMVVEVTPANPSHPLLEGVFEGGKPVRWWLESASRDVMVVPGASVDVLVESEALEKLGRSKVIAATFAYGSGRVLHVMGHYYQQKGHVAGAAAAQRLALNFVRERLERSAAAR